MHESVVSGKEKIGVDTSPKTGAQATELRTPLAKKRRPCVKEDWRRILVKRRTEEGYYPAPEISREAVKWRPNLKYTFEFQVLQNSVRHFHQMLHYTHHIFQDATFILATYCQCLYHDQHHHHHHHH